MSKNKDEEYIKGKDIDTICFTTSANTAKHEFLWPEAQLQNLQIKQS